MAFFGEVTVEERPATVTAFVHVVASHEVLRGEFWNVSAIFQL
jgi:hypothetical protein